MFPLNTITTFLQNNTTLTGVILPAVNYDRTLLATRIVCKENGDNSILIGTTTIKQTISQLDIFFPIYIKIPSGQNVTFKKQTSGHNCNYTLNHIDYIYGVGASNGQVVPSSSFSSGELMIATLLFILMFIELIKLLKSGIKSVPVVRRFQGNNSPDGKEFYEL